MVNRTKRAALKLSTQERQQLERLSRSQTAPTRETARARVLLNYADGRTIVEIQRLTGQSRPTIYKCIDKALAAGVNNGLRDLPHRPFPPEIDSDAIAWVTAIACTKPKDHGLAAELWTLTALTNYVTEHGPSAGHARLGAISRSSIHRILNAHALKPHRVRYYLERRDPEFERKMHDVLMVYRDVFVEDRTVDADGRHIYTVSVDEKPGVQAIANVGEDRLPVVDQQPSIARDAEYRRLGTLSILAALDLHTGNIVARVEARHRSREFIGLLQALDQHYPADAVIRIVLDNHTAHTSKETRAYLATRPNRFVYVHTPKHGSWLNLIETVFSRMARTFLRHIRVTSVDELKARIELGIAEMNAHPAHTTWSRYDLDELDLT